MPLLTVQKRISNRELVRAHPCEALEYQVKDSLAKELSYHVLNHWGGHNIKGIADYEGSTYSLSLYVATRKELEDYVQSRIQEITIRTLIEGE